MTYKFCSWVVFLACCSSCAHTSSLRRIKLLFKKSIKSTLTRHEELQNWLCVHIVNHIKLRDLQRNCLWAKPISNQEQKHRVISIQPPARKSIFRLSLSKLKTEVCTPKTSYLKRTSAVYIKNMWTKQFCSYGCSHFGTFEKRAPDPLACR